MAFRKVKCVNDKQSAEMLEVGKVYDVLVIVAQGADHRGILQKPGYIVNYQKNSYGYPFVWDIDRFVEVFDESK